MQRDHPRRCGENEKGDAFWWQDKGSPPQVRGKPIWKAASGKGVGITPAGAGKTLLGAGYGDELKDHPRRCGENLTVCRVITF